jgi:hypothetical protein
MTRAEQVAQLRPLLARSIHAVFAPLPLIDCARIANRTLDELEDGKPELARSAEAFFDHVIALQESKHQ